MTAHFTFGAHMPLFHGDQGQAITGVTLHLADGGHTEASTELVTALATAARAIHTGATVHLGVDDDLVTPERAAQLLGVSRPAIYTWQDRGDLGRVQVGGKRMVPLADVLRKQEERAATHVRVAELRSSPVTEAEIEAGMRHFGSVPLGQDPDALSAE